MPRFLTTWSFRLTLLYAGLFTLSVLFLFGVIYWSALGYAVQDETDEINLEFSVIVSEAERAGYDALPRIIENHLQQRAGMRVAYLLQDSSDRKIAGNIAAMPFRDGSMTVSIESDGKSRKLQARFYRLRNGDRLLIGEDSFALNEMKELVAKAFGVSVAATLILAVAGGVVVSKSVLRRVESVASTSDAIIGGDLSQRVPLRGNGDEFDHLASSVNAMLDRIEDLMRSVRQVSNDIAHDLRTPLTRLRQRLELASRRSQSVEELRESLSESTKQVDSILATFGALLGIAQIEARQSSQSHREIGLSPLLEEIAADFAPSAEDNRQCLITDIQPGLTIVGDRMLLTQMVANLLENALRHSPPGTRISLEGKENGNEVLISVADTGPGIPEAERERVLRPFYRLEASRTTEGSGLGLSLIAAIAKLHDATLTLSDNAPGLRIAVLFPERTNPHGADDAGPPPPIG